MGLISTKKAAALLDVSPSFFSKHTEIPRYKMPGCRPVRFDEDELLEWAKSQLVEQVVMVPTYIKKKRFAQGRKDEARL